MGQDSSIWRFLSSKSWKVRRWRRSQRLKALVKKGWAQVLHSHFGNHGWDNIGLAREAGLQHVVTFNGYEATLLPQRDPIWIERFQELFDYAHLFPSEDPFFGEHPIKMDCSREKMKVQHLGVLPGWNSPGGQME